ncbi:MAG: glycosyltransferase family 4 protein [Gloeobacterales cyanobacterium]
MKIENLLVTGENVFIDRRKFLFVEMANQLKNIEFLPREMEWYEKKYIKQFIKAFYTMRMLSRSKANSLFEKNAGAFILKSKRSEHRISQLERTPDYVFHIFGTYSPFWERSDIPYAVYLDYTMALAEKAWTPWATFSSRKERDAWLKCETQLYQRSHHLFVMSDIVKNSLIEDYRIDARKITTVGLSSIFREPYEGLKTFGSQRILFIGSDFERKGGDIVLKAFKFVKEKLPNVSLTMVGKKLKTSIEGIETPGSISSHATLEQLFLNADLAIAPAHCEPMGIFILDAMSCGVPCIVSANDWNGIPEFLEHGVDGIKINQLCPELLANHIISLLENTSTLESMSHAARNIVKTQLNWKAIAHKIMQTVQGNHTLTMIVLQIVLQAFWEYLIGYDALIF